MNKYRGISVRTVSIKKNLTFSMKWKTQGFRKSDSSWSLCAYVYSNNECLYIQMFMLLFFLLADIRLDFLFLTTSSSFGGVFILLRAPISVENEQKDKMIFLSLCQSLSLSL